jgi:dTDP-4-amino-4,6-dideoxygalactose transaminase
VTPAIPESLAPEAHAPSLSPPLSAAPHAVQQPAGPEPIPFVDLKAQMRSMRAEIDAAIAGVLDSCHFTLGPEVEAFEQEFAAYCQRPFGVAVNTGTSALHLALLAAGVGPGDEVITVPFTFVATASAIDYTGARPVFVDIDPATLTMDPRALEAAITPRTRAILPVHLYGLMADMDAIGEIARRHGLVVVEDAAQAHGAELHGRRAGSFGHLACFSFYPGKNLGACGEGGMVVTGDADLARRVRLLRDWGAPQKYHHEIKGYNFRMEAIQGAVLRAKLRHLPAWTEARARVAARYDELLKGTSVRAQATPTGYRHVHHVYAVRTPAREAWQHALARQGVSTGIHYPKPIHLLPAFRELGGRRGQFPHAEAAAQTVLSLPMYAELADAQVQRVGQAVRALALAEVPVVSRAAAAASRGTWAGVPAAAGVGHAGAA